MRFQEDANEALGNVLSLALSSHFSSVHISVQLVLNDTKKPFGLKVGGSLLGCLPCFQRTALGTRRLVRWAGRLLTCARALLVLRLGPGHVHRPPLGNTPHHSWSWWCPLSRSQTLSVPFCHLLRVCFLAIAVIVAAIVMMLVLI